MNPIPVEPLSAMQSLAEALLIGLLIGVQRESTPGEHPGLRDFLLIALAGGVCGLLEQPWLTVAALLSITTFLTLYHWEQREKRTGITTEMAAVATFCITYLTAVPGFPMAAPIAIAAAIAVAAFLEFKKRLTSFFREVITEQEFNGTLAFLAVVLVIYPLLPAGRYGPYHFFAPREVWFFVIMVSCISYAGYFMQKFLGARKGLDYTAVLGGVASTLATTLDLARRSRHDPANSAAYARAAVMANTVQFPRTLLIVALTNAAMAPRAAVPLGVSLVFGVGLSWLLTRWVTDVEAQAAPSGNPFRLRPTLTFGALFTAVVFINKAAISEFGHAAVYATSALGGLIDPGTVVLSSSDLLNRGSVPVDQAVSYVLVAVAASMLFKCIMAVVVGAHAFAWRLLLSLALMFGAGLGAWFVLLGKFT